MRSGSAVTSVPLNITDNYHLLSRTLNGRWIIPGRLVCSSHFALTIRIFFRVLIACIEWNRVFQIRGCHGGGDVIGVVHRVILRVGTM